MASSFTGLKNYPVRILVCGFIECEFNVMTDVEKVRLHTVSRVKHAAPLHCWCLVASAPIGSRRRRAPGRCSRTSNAHKLPDPCSVDVLKLKCSTSTSLPAVSPWVSPTRSRRPSKLLKVKFVVFDIVMITSQTARSPHFTSSWGSP